MNLFLTYSKKKFLFLQNPITVYGFINIQIQIIDFFKIKN